MKETGEKLKILYLITKSNFGGAQRYVCDLATCAHDEGHDVVVGFGNDGPLGEKLREVGIRTVVIEELERDISITKDIRSFLALYRLIRSERPDVVHLNSSKIGGLGGLAGRFSNGIEHIRALFQKPSTTARIIFTGHAWAFNEERSDLERFVIGALHWLTIMLAHRTIAVSRKTREQVGILPFTWHRLVVIHNGIGNCKSVARKTALETILGEDVRTILKDKPVVIGTLAELHNNKGLTYAIEGMALLKKQMNIPFVFLILGEGEERGKLERLIATLGLKDLVYLPGRIADGAKQLSAFDIFLLPSITEAFPYAILEAGNAGLPVVATAVGGIPEVIDDMESGILIHSRNSAEIARAIKYLIDHPDRRELFASRIKQRIAGRFTLKAMCDATFAVYRD